MTPLQTAFISVINLSIAASFLMLAVILLRSFLKKIPKWLVCALWGMVALRLVVPFSLESKWSLVPTWKVSIAQEKPARTVNDENQQDVSRAEDRQSETVAKNSSEGHDAERANAISAGKTWENPSEENSWQTFSRENDGENMAHVEETTAEGLASKRKDNGSTAFSETKEHDLESVQASVPVNEKSAEELSMRKPGESVKSKGFGETDEHAAATAEGILKGKLQGVLLMIGSGIWLAGIIAMLAYAAISFVRLRSRLRTAVRLEVGTGVKAWVSDAITEPFVLGIVSPRIYLPSTLEAGDLECVLGHERAHVKRGDYLWKPFGFLILCVYWFHPLCWISYLLFCRDVEMACDEKATKDFIAQERKRYCQALLNISQGKKDSLIGTVAFGENGTKSRVKAVLNYKKPSLWMILAGTLAGFAVGFLFMTSPNGNSIGSWLAFPTKIQRSEVVYDEEGNAQEISFDLKLHNSSMGIVVSGCVLYDGNTYYDAKEVFRDKWEGDGSNLFFIHKDYAQDVWKDYVRIDPLDDKMDSYLLRITTAGEEKTYYSERPEGKQSNTTFVPMGTEATPVNGAAMEAEKINPVRVEVQDNVTLFQAVLRGERDFYVAAGEEELFSVNIADVPRLFESSDPYLKVNSFAVVDLDHDGEEEVILFVISAGNEGRVILRRWGNMVYAYVVDYRSMWELKTDGSYEYNMGNVNDGFARITDFTESGFEEDRYTYETGPIEGADTFVVDHKVVSENELKKAFILEHGKKKAVWLDFNEESIMSLSEDFQRRVSLTDPQVLKTQILREISQMEFAFPWAACTGGHLVINEDGSFSGGYDSRFDPPYHYHESRFTGSLEITKIVDAYTCQIKVTELCCEKEPGTKWKDGEFFYEEILPPGMEEGGEYLLCLPGKPVEELPRGILCRYGMEIERAGEWTDYGIGAIPKTEEEAFTDLEQWKTYDLIEYGEDLALYCRNVYPSLMKEWSVKALSPDRSMYLYGKSENQDGKTVLTIGVISAYEYHRPTEFRLNAETSNDIVKVYWLSDTLVGAETGVNSSAEEYFIYDLVEGKEVRH